MAAEQKDGEDLSMEEILQSIRKIIADDGDAAPPADAATETSEEVSDILELSEVVEDDNLLEAVESEPAPAVDVLKEIDDAMGGDQPAEPAQEPIEEPVEAAVEEAPALVEEPVEAAPEPVEAPAKTKVDAPVAAPKEAVASDAGQTESERLLSENAANASVASLHKMIETQKANHPGPGFRTGNTVEDLVIESIKPMLKDWLDTNLPSMVERMVEREIRKLVD